jgi:hypothetical protein
MTSSNAVDNAPSVPSFRKRQEGWKYYGVLSRIMFIWKAMREELYGVATRMLSMMGAVWMMRNATGGWNYNR